MSKTAVAVLRAVDVLTRGPGRLSCPRALPGPGFSPVPALLHFPAPLGGWRGRTPPEVPGEVVERGSAPTLLMAHLPLCSKKQKTLFFLCKV